MFRWLFLSLLTLLAACSIDGNRPLSDPFLRKLAGTEGVQAAGSDAVLVYLAKDSGKILPGCHGRCDREQVVRLLVRKGKARGDLDPHGKLTGASRPFTFFDSTGGAVSRYGFIRYQPSPDRTVWIERHFGDGEPIDTMGAQMQLNDVFFAEFQYKGDSEASHIDAVRAVDSYLSLAGAF